MPPKAPNLANLPKVRRIKIDRVPERKKRRTRKIRIDHQVQLALVPQEIDQREEAREITGQHEVVMKRRKKRQLNRGQGEMEANDL